MIFQMELPKSAANLYIPSATLHLRYYARAIPSRDAFYVEIGLCIGELLHALRQAAFWRAINPLLEDAFLQIEARAQARAWPRAGRPLSCQDSEKVVSGRWLADDEITEAADQSLLWKLSQNT